MSRAAVAKHVAAIKAAGFDVEAAPGTGYRLLSLSEALDPLAVRVQLRSARWAEIVGGGPTASTMDDATSLARAGAPDGTVVVADRQTGGRGRLGRSWTSPEGGVYLSVVLRPRVGVSTVTAFPLVASLAVAEALRGLGVDARLKWPNDVLGPDGKLSGVLLEMAAEADAVSWIVVGIGINVLPHGERTPGASYVADAAPVTRPAVAAAVLDALDTAVASFEADGFGPARLRYERLLDTRDKDVVVSGLDGTPRAEGVALGVDDRGRLVVAGAAGEVHLESGDVTLRDPS